MMSTGKIALDALGFPAGMKTIERCVEVLPVNSLADPLGSKLERLAGAVDAAQSVVMERYERDVDGFFEDILDDDSPVRGLARFTVYAATPRTVQELSALQDTGLVDAKQIALTGIMHALSKGVVGQPYAWTTNGRHEGGIIGARPMRFSTEGTALVLTAPLIRTLGKPTDEKILPLAALARRTAETIEGSQLVTGVEPVKALINNQIAGIREAKDYKASPVHNLASIVSLANSCGMWLNECCDEKDVVWAEEVFTDTFTTGKVSGLAFLQAAAALTGVSNEAQAQELFARTEQAVLQLFSPDVVDKLDASEAYVLLKEVVARLAVLERMKAGVTDPNHLAIAPEELSGSLKTDLQEKALAPLPRP